MAILIVIILLAILALWWDKKRFNKKIRTFELKARDYLELYGDMLAFITKAKEEPDIEFFEWYGMIYTAFAKAGENEDQFYEFMKKLGEDALKSYEDIGDRNLNDLDGDDYQYISSLYHKVLSLYGQVRYQCWIRSGNKSSAE